ncbi:hypothetical protein VT03_26195 [Planctomyces sp. SH-PL14]|nr:hypothetical protein VT03_26195 [Planctomyces sp. SH-PL14]
MIGSSLAAMLSLVATVPAWPAPASSPPADGFPPPGERPPARPDGVQVLNPRGRVPVSLIIDDSTCLVNLAHFCIPHFAEVYPDRYRQDWRKLPREIPDTFVRSFGEWCREHGVKGKYSVVPYPACVGWVDRDMPGWSRRELLDSLKLIREFLMVDWDIHPEMVTHTFAIDTKTGRPYPDRTDPFLENTGFSVGKSADELADYMGYALRILKNAGMTCEGVTTPGGFGNRNRLNLAIGAGEAIRDVFGAEVPHYFRYLFTDEQSVAPRVENAAGLGTDDPRCVVSIIGCTGDWFGGWDGLEKGTVDQFITADLRGGRLPQVIDRGEPAVLVCHWPGLYFNGEHYGFHVFQEVVRRLHARYDHLVWMKLSELSRYWAARELTAIAADPPAKEAGAEKGAAAGWRFRAPFSCPAFTVRLPGETRKNPVVAFRGEKTTLRRVDRAWDLTGGAWRPVEGGLELCFDLSKGESSVSIEGD